MALTTPLLLLSLLSLTAAITRHHQNLTVAPLQPPAPFIPETLTPETTTAVATGGASAYVRLAHRDSLLPASTPPAQILRLRLARDAARVRSLSAALTAPKPPSFSSPVVSGLSQGSGEYFARIGVGSPPTPAHMVLDTGSDVVWLQCAPCRHCYSQSDPIFDPRRSKSYAPLRCKTPQCRLLDVSACHATRKNCLYQVSYGDGSITTGDLSTETLTFRGGFRVPRVVLGCGHDNEGLFVAAAGLLGLGRGRLSFPSQVRRPFSYCLVDRTSDKAPNRSSVLVFGDGAVPRASAGVAYTPMVRNPKVETFYYVGLSGVSVGGSRVAGFAVSALRLDPATGRGGVIVDSGTSVTRLARPAYEALRDAFKAGAAGLKEAAGGFSLFDTCYDLSGKTEVKVPTVVMHFAGGAAVRLPAENYLIPVDTKGTYCFAFAGTDSAVSIIGNIQQQGFKVAFDSIKARIGFVPAGC